MTGIGWKMTVTRIDELSSAFIRLMSFSRKRAAPWLRSWSRDKKAIPTAYFEPVSCILWTRARHERHRMGRREIIHVSSMSCALNLLGF